MLFNIRKQDRYDGLVSVTFKDGKLLDILSNSSTDDPEWVSFVSGLVDGMSNLYADGGTDGLSALAEEFFLPDARPYFWKALVEAGISTDRDAVSHSRDRATLISIVSMLSDLIYVGESGGK